MFFFEKKNQKTFIPEEVAGDLWVVDGAPLRVFGLVLPIRMTVVRLADGALLLHSPVQFRPELAEALRRLGPVRHFVAPNIAHWTMLRDWQSAFPTAQTTAAPGLRQRRPVRRSALRIDAEIGATLPPAWQPDLDHVIVPGAAGFREVAFLHRPTRSAILTDLVQNLDPRQVPRLGRLLGIGTRTGWPPIYLRLAVRLAGEPARAAARSILAWQPDRVIFSHGAWFERDGAAELAQALRWLLPHDAPPQRPASS